MENLLEEAEKLTNINFTMPPKDILENNVFETPNKGPVSPIIANESPNIINTQVRNSENF